MTFNGHYAVPPTGYYTQPPAVPPFSTPSFQYGIPPPIPPSANVQRFEANAQVPSPPIPYWNPEILKQLSQLPVPPPPPPSIPHAPGTPPFIRPLSNAPQPQFQNTNNDRIGVLHERAKQAITDLIPYIRYQDFLDEGISQSVLDKLYSELRLEKGHPPTKSIRDTLSETAVEPPSEPAPDPPHDQLAEPVVDAGLERKDRIARLLAAKKGRVTTGTNSPAQASTPEVPPAVSEAVATATPDFVKTPTPDIPVATEEAPTPVAQEVPLPFSDSTSPIPNRDAATSADVSSRGFSIPGLFMTADDHTDSGVVQTRPKVNTDKLNARMAELKADMLRKKALQDGMPVLNAEVEKMRDRLTERRNKLATIREDILTKEHQLSRAREDEARLVEEIELLERQLVEGENGQEQFNRELTQLNNQITEQEKEGITQSFVASATDSVILAQQPSTLSSLPIITPATAADEDEDIDNEIGEGFSLAQSLESAAESDNSHEYKEDVVMDEAGLPNTEYIDTEPSYETQSTHMTTTATPSNVPSIRGNDDNDGDSDERMSIDGISDGGSGGSASMSDSGSEYEPAVDQIQSSIQATGEEDEEDEDDEYDPLNPNLHADQPEIEIDNDEYEPSERLESINVSSMNEVHPEGDLSTDAKSLPEGEQTTNESPVMAIPGEELPLTSTFPTRHSSVDRVVIAAKVDNETLTQQQDHPTSSDAYEEIAPLDNKPGSNQSYTPYKSPLTMLKSFRFHPQFTELIPNGYRSLTYSNQVDANRPLCTTELEGKMCTDTECEDQHFAAMALTDDKILVQMSSAFDIKDKAQRDAYLIGLKKVIADLREKGVKEFSEVAGALSKYRRKWQATQDGIVV